MEPRNVIVRHSAPSILDEAEYGSVCICKDKVTDAYDLYAQVSKMSDKPTWELMGEFNAQTPQIYIDDILNERLNKTS